MNARALAWTRALALALTLALATVAATTARGASSLGFTSFASTLPSSTGQNLPGAIALPPNWTTPPAVPELRSDSELLALWQGSAQTYGVPWQVLAAINKIESNFGQNMGPSSAGALGWMQFMPSTWLSWGVDADGDGFANPWSAADAIYAAGRYLAAAGGQADIRRAIFAYNHADWYVNEVLQLAGLFSTAGVAGTTQLVQQSAQLQRAQQEIVATNQALVVAQKAELRTRREYARLAVRVNRATLLSDRLAAEKIAVLAGVRHDRAQAEVRRLELRLRTQETSLASARASAASSSFSQGGATVLQAQSYSSGYVFPVGGGPQNVTVSHTHHDYPAVDIAAPQGSPIYAFADLTVVRSYRYPSGRCGIGMTFLTADGRSWTYCHMSYLEPAVQPGAAFAAGAPVGLVGMTGHATGPHLHMQLNPPTSYPQAEGWFQAFAGRAFRWNDAPTPLEPADAPPAASARTLEPQSAAAATPLPAPAPAPTSAAPTPHDVFARVPTRQQGHSELVRFTR